mmetsp:Transcript_58992/g.120839  ORF Transcript_58992/g.120839 Transcript_58992/m.120839 type:complete len:391 (+) Transcript_58992:139-1311(+)|eukprot:CAMPEP_0181310604 /NCGR_PEP_ID=MMETSP1101-20121128/12676_1 /TAXON_ID=46948 /ORGANISM="Rhodomonas abbreviata, Strain Caron Lab Isolate" /LENGTH=390 /DNA_ID=CAMNT_0023417247 /DNA_START=124 /DNA_END=1296 /DNA_ORIENTATION=+
MENSGEAATSASPPPSGEGGSAAKKKNRRSNARQDRWEVVPDTAGPDAQKKKMKICPIGSWRGRRATFMKRKVGLLKKARELSVLCGSEVVIMMTDLHGSLVTFESKDGDLDRLFMLKVNGHPSENFTNASSILVGDPNYNSDEYSSASGESVDWDGLGHQSPEGLSTPIGGIPPPSMAAGGIPMGNPGMAPGGGVQGVPPVITHHFAPPSMTKPISRVSSDESDEGPVWKRGSSDDSQPTYIAPPGARASRQRTGQRTGLSVEFAPSVGPQAQFGEPQMVVKSEEPDISETGIEELNIADDPRSANMGDGNGWQMPKAEWVQNIANELEADPSSVLGEGGVSSIIPGMPPGWGMGGEMQNQMFPPDQPGSGGLWGWQADPGAGGGNGPG